MAKATTKRVQSNSEKTLPKFRYVSPDATPSRYVARCIGNCMAPTVPDGAAVVVDRTEPIVRGDLAVLFFKPEHAPSGHQAIIKRVVMPPPPYVKFPWKEHPQSDVHSLVIVERDNPPQRLAYKCEHLLAIHKCLGPVPSDATYDANTAMWAIAAHKMRR